MWRRSFVGYSELGALTTMQYQVVYDILNEPTDISFILVWIAGIIVGTGFLLYGIRLHNRFHRIFSSIWLSGWIILGGLGFGNVYFQRAQCNSWARVGDVQLAEGPITDFKPSDGHHDEEFTVGDTTFKYADNDLSRCGFSNTTAYGGPIHSGLQVRIAHHGGHILKLEIAQ